MKIIYDNPETMRREISENGEVVAWCNFELIQDGFHFNYLPYWCRFEFGSFPHPTREIIMI
jgi:hypothetical protein